MPSRSTVRARGRGTPDPVDPLGEEVTAGQAPAAAADLLDHGHRDPRQHARRAGHPRHPRGLRPARLARRALRGGRHAARHRHGAGDRRARRPLRAPSGARPVPRRLRRLRAAVGARPDASPRCSLLRLLQGIGSAGLINLAVVLIGDHWTGLERARLVGQNAAILTVSLAVFPPLGGLLTELGGWRLSFAALRARAGHRGAHLPPPRRQPAGRRRRRCAPSSRGAGTAHPPPRRARLDRRSGFVIFMLIFGLFLTAMPVHLERSSG